MVEQGSVGEAGYGVAHLDEIEELSPEGRCSLRPVRHRFGISAFGVTAWVGHAAGDRVVNEHDEGDVGQEELYLVLRGRASFELDGERRDAPAGTFVFAPPAVKRTAFAAEPDTCVLAIGGRPGKAYAPSGWELWEPARPLYEAGEYAAAADRARELVAAYPQYAALVYNLACCESLAGRTEDALGHLRQALEMSEELRELAQTDTDLDPIRGEPAFGEIVPEAQAGR